MIVHIVSVNLEEMKYNLYQQSVMNWLAAPNPSTNHNRALHQCHTNTGRWFLQSDAFKQWKERSASFLWLQGIPGCGKTILSSVIVDHLERNTTAKVIYFYFDTNDRTKQSFSDMLRSLISQLCHEQSQALDELYTSHGRKSQDVSESSLRDVLQTMLSQAHSVSIILDALDESNSRPQLLEFLEVFNKTRRTTCRLLVTSRQDTSVGQNWVQSQNKMMIQKNELDADIAAYIHYRVRENSAMRRWYDRPDVQKFIEERLERKANGM